MADEVELSIQGEVAFVRLRSPERGNALSGTMFDSLRKIALRLQDVPPRYLVLSGEGADFCRGLDIRPDEPMFRVFEPLVRARDAHRAQEVVKQFRASIDAIARLPCPVIAAIEGRCHGAGLELALVADLRVAGADSTFRLGEQRFGILPGLGGMARLSLLLGHARACDVVLTGRELAADEAVATGLVTRTAPAGSALTSALDLVHELRRSAPTARMQSLLALRAIQHKLVQELVEQESQAASRTWIAGEWITALAALRDGREPSW